MGKNQRQSNSMQWRKDAQAELNEEAEERELERRWYEDEEPEDDEDYSGDDMVEPGCSDGGSCYEKGEEYSGYGEYSLFVPWPNLGKEGGE